MGRTDTFFGEVGHRRAAWLFLPDDTPTSHRLPVVVMAHGLGAVRTMRLDVYAQRFCAAGYACLVFDYRHFGASEGEPRQLLSVAGQLEDWRAAIAHARGLPGIDPDAVVAWGSSFGGGHVLSIAAEDSRLAAAIAQCPFTDGPASLHPIPPVTSLKLMRAALLDLVHAARGKPPVMVPTAGKPGDTALMTAPDAAPGYLGLVDEGDDGGFRNEVAARVAWQVARYAPGREAPKIACPLFVALCEKDSVAPARTTRRQVSRAPQAEIASYDLGHFDIYVGEPFERAVSDMLAFLQRQVPVL